ncbi:MAG: nuclear transport factor 2 family protein [Rhizobiaceae bacterium]
MPVLGQNYAEVVDTVATYFDGLYNCDVAALAQVFHPGSHLASVTEGPLLQMDLPSYLAVVAKRESPASRKEVRSDRIVSIEFAGPTTAFARVKCSIGPKLFTDLLSLILVDGRWQIISKVYHFDPIKVS